MRTQQPLLTALLSALVGRVAADSGFSIGSPDDIKKTSATITKDLLAYYHGDEPGQIPGILPGPPGSKAGVYYWFQGANLWSTLIDYWHYTGDSSHNDLIKQGLLFQRGENDDYLPANFSASIGNDDQADWALAAILAAERGFPSPPSDKPQWIDLATNVFNEMAARWDTKTCDGGLRWQISSFNQGYDVKLCSANTRFFDLAARLARYTGNKTYVEWADKTWDWMENIKVLDNSSYAIYEGAHVQDDCKSLLKSEITADNGHFALGAAFLYNQTNGDQKWKDRATKLLDHGIKTFFDNGVAYEPSCEPKHHCGQGTLSYKGELMQAYTLITQVAPFTVDKIEPVLKKTAAAAVKRCSSGEDGKQCGFEWADKTYDRDSFTQGAIQQMNAAIAVDALLVGSSKPPATSGKKGENGNGGNGGSGGGGGNGGGDDGKGGKGGDNKSTASGLVSTSVMASIISPLLSFLLA